MKLEVGSWRFFRLLVLVGLFVANETIANITAEKLVAFGPFIVPAAVFAYAITFIVADSICEVYGKRIARQVVFLGFLGVIVLLVMVQLAIHLPPARFYTEQKEFEMVLGGTARVLLASLTSYLVAQLIDIGIFHRLRQKHGEKYLWLRSSVSVSISQLVDTICFIHIAFVFVVPYPIIWQMIFSQYIIKFTIAVVGIPVFYLAVAFLRGENPLRLYKQQLVSKS